MCGLHIVFSACLWNRECGRHVYGLFLGEEGDGSNFAFKAVTGRDDADTAQFTRGRVALEAEAFDEIDVVGDEAFRDDVDVGVKRGAAGDAGVWGIGREVACGVKALSPDLAVAVDVIIFDFEGEGAFTADLAADAERLLDDAEGDLELEGLIVGDVLVEDLAYKGICMANADSFKVESWFTRYFDDFCFTARLPFQIDIPIGDDPTAEIGVKIAVFDEVAFGAEGAGGLAV